MVVETPEAMKDSIENLGSFTVSFWMKATKCNKANRYLRDIQYQTVLGYLISILKVIRKRYASLFKVHLRNGNAERTEECRIDDVFINDWVHLSFKYDETTSKLTVYKKCRRDSFQKALSEGEAQNIIPESSNSAMWGNWLSEHCSFKQYLV